MVGTLNCWWAVSERHPSVGAAILTSDYVLNGSRKYSKRRNGSIKYKSVLLSSSFLMTCQMVVRSGRAITQNDSPHDLSLYDTQLLAGESWSLKISHTHRTSCSWKPLVGQGKPAVWKVMANLLYLKLNTHADTITWKLGNFWTMFPFAW